MAKITSREITIKGIWEKFVLSYLEANFLQSWGWGEFHESLDKKIFRTGFYKDYKLVGVMLSIIEDAKRARYLTIPGGPLINWNDKNVVNIFMKEIKKIAKENNCVFVRVRPQLLSNNFSKKLFRRLGFRDAPMHLHAELTSQLSLNKNEEEILKGMRKTTRHEIKKAVSQGVKILSSTDQKLFGKFYNLQVETAKRQNFVPFSKNFLQNQFETFSRAGNSLLYSAFFQNKLLAQAFVIFYGKEADYHYGASTEFGRKYPGAHFIQWEAIREAKRRGMERYNFWGVAPIDDINHRFHGVSVFKRGFGGLDVEYLHAQDLIVKKLHYMINWTLEEVRRRVRKL